MNRNFRIISLFGFSALLLFGSITAAADNCDRRIRKAEQQLQQAVQRHGEHSRQAENKRRDLERARASCRR